MAIGYDIDLNKAVLNSVTSVQSYAEQTNRWKHQYKQTERSYCFCCCSFMNKIFVIGGLVKNNDKSVCCTYNKKVIN